MGIYVGLDSRCLATMSLFLTLPIRSPREVNYQARAPYSSHRSRFLCSHKKDRTPEPSERQAKMDPGSTDVIVSSELVYVEDVSS